VAFVAGDGIAIYQVLLALDMAGVSGGSDLSGLTVNSTPPVGWNNQIVTGSYSWNNKEDDNSPVNFSASTRIPKEGVHYFNDTPKPGYTQFQYPHPLTQEEDVNLTGTYTIAKTVTLNWTGATAANVDILRNGVVTVAQTPNDGTQDIVETGSNATVQHTYAVRSIDQSPDLII
jgi:hypothetical protein